MMIFNIRMCVKLKYYSFKGEEEWDRKMKKENQRDISYQLEK